MKILNLDAGLGGNRKLWGDEHEVTAVEIDKKIAGVYHELFPNDKVVVGDSKEYLLNHYQEFDFIWSSRPCQSHTRMIRSGKNRKPRMPDMSLYEFILFLEYNFKGKWVVENVKPYYKPFMNPKAIGRHLFWSNFEIKDFVQENIPNFIMKCNTDGAEELKKWLGLNYEGNIYYDGNHDPAQVLRNCVHPKLGLHVIKSVPCTNENIENDRVRGCGKEVSAGIDRVHGYSLHNTCGCTVMGETYLCEECVKLGVSAQ